MSLSLLWGIDDRGWAEFLWSVGSVLSSAEEINLSHYYRDDTTTFDIHKVWVQMFLCQRRLRGLKPLRPREVSALNQTAKLRILFSLGQLRSSQTEIRFSIRGMSPIDLNRHSSSYIEISIPFD